MRHCCKPNLPKTGSAVEAEQGLTTTVSDQKISSFTTTHIHKVVVSFIVTFICLMLFHDSSNAIDAVFFLLDMPLFRYADKTGSFFSYIANTATAPAATIPAKLEPICLAPPVNVALAAAPVGEILCSVSVPVGTVVNVLPPTTNVDVPGLVQPEDI